MEHVREFMKILIVDDTKAFRHLLKDSLKKIGFKNVTEAENGKMALDTLIKADEESAGFELVICDYNMPEMNGLELLRNMQQTKGLNSIPFLILTVESDKRLVLNAISMGVSDFMVKPFSEKILEEKIKRLVS